MMLRRALVTLALFVVVLSGAPVFAQSAGTSGPQAKVQTEEIIPGSPLESSAEGFARGGVKSLPNYISIIYNFLLGTIGLVAAVSLTWAGFRYLTAGGDPKNVSIAKTRIRDSILGLALAFIAYLLLNTISPDLLRFRPLTIPTVTTETLDYAKVLGGDAGTLCKTDADCRSPYTCMIVKEAPLEKGLNYFGTAIGIALSFPTGAASVAAAGAKTAFSGAKIVLKFVGRSFLAAPVATTGAVAAAGAGGALAWSQVAALGYAGVCGQEANHDVTLGGWCSKPSHCAVGTCVQDPNVSNICVGCGICSDGSNGSFCRPNATTDCQSGFACVEASDGVWFCSNGSQGSTCSSDGDCKGAGLICRKTLAIGGIGYCSSAQQGGVNAACKTNNDCQSGGNQSFTCLIPASNPNCGTQAGAAACVCAPSKAESTAGTPCYCDDQCASGNYCKTKTGESGAFYNNFCVATLGSCTPGSNPNQH